MAKKGCAHTLFYVIFMYIRSTHHLNDYNLHTAIGFANSQICCTARKVPGAAGRVEPGKTSGTRAARQASQVSEQQLDARHECLGTFDGCFGR